MSQDFHQVRFSPRLLRFIAALVFAVYAGTAASTSFRAVDIEEVSKNAELIFEGRVTAVESRAAPSSKLIHTFVTFAIDDVIKGNYSKPTIVLSFLGGSAGGRTLIVDDVQPPEIGEKGIYFVESLTRTQVDPFYGGPQGHFVIRHDADQVDRVETQDGRLVVGFGSRAQSSAPGPAIGNQESVPDEPALGLKLLDSSTGTVGMTAEDFKQHIRGFVGKGQ